MEILFTQTRRNQYTVTYTAAVDGEEVGRASLIHHGRPALELRHLQLTKQGVELMSREEFLEAFCAYLKERGHEELTLESEDMELDGWCGFQLEDRDNSGWYPKYLFRRRL